MIEHKLSFLLLEDFCETILLEKQGLKNLIKKYKFQLFLDWVKFYESFSEDRIKKIFDESNYADYHFNNFAYINFFKKFIIEINNLIEVEKDFFNNLKEKTNLDESYFENSNQNSLILINDIFCLGDRYSSLLQLSSDPKFLEVKSKIELIYKVFSEEYFSFKNAKNVDQVITGISLGEMQIINRINYKKQEKEIIYLDTNIFSKIMEEPDLKDKFISSKNKYQYCYSAYMLEDKVKQNILFTNHVFELITQLTDNLTVFYQGVFPNLIVDYAFEDPNIIYDRVKLWLFQTESAEDNQYNKMILNKLWFQTDEKVKYFDHNKMVDYLKNPSKELLLFSSSIGADNAFDKNPNNLYCKINDLLLILNILRFRIDTDKSKVISSFQDEEHIKIGHSADYFITSDQKLFDRAKIIYEVCECHTKVMLLKEFSINC